MLQFGIIALLVALTAGQNPLAKTEIGQPKTSSAQFLLPNDLSPNLYNIELEPHLEAETFNGSVTISFTMNTDTDTIKLHAYELDIPEDRINLLDSNGNTINSVRFTTFADDDRHFFTIVFNEPILGGRNYSIVFSHFSGILNRENDGFYIGQYEEYGVIRKFATTQFEATGARRAFPCFDEPALRAQFLVTIIRTSGYSSVSNTRKISTELISEGRYKDSFQKTPRMSTYLLGFVISDFEFIISDEQRVFLRPSVTREGRGAYALNASIAILQEIADYVNVPYTLDKMDTVGIPEGYFWPGAMENWGLITYREAYLMYVNGLTTSTRRQQIVTIIAHELVHKWFGNLVSPQWWSYLWLSEGFATYLQYYSASTHEKGMDIVDQVVVKTVHNALLQDSRPDTRPMTRDVGSPSDIFSLFDVITYDKSAAVIRMMEGVLTSKVFRHGLNIYLRKMEFQAARPIDLYNALQDALEQSTVDVLPANENIASIMTTWELNAGYPVVTATRNYQTGDILLSQNRFTTASGFPDVLWSIPITYATNTNNDFNDTNVDFWLTTRTKIVNFHDLLNNDFYLFNIKQQGYYRVNYDVENWNRLINCLGSDKYDTIHRLNRAQLIDDSFNLARAGAINYRIPLDLTRYLPRETDYIPLQAFFNSLSFLDTFLANTDVYYKFQIYILEAFRNIYNSLTIYEFAGDAHTTKLNRVNIINWVCRYGNLDCQYNSLSRLRSWNIFGGKIEPNLQTVVPCSALRVGDQQDWELLYNIYINSIERDQRERVLSALGCSENQNILLSFLFEILEPHGSIRPADRLSAIASIYNSGNFGLNIAYSFIKINYDAFVSRFKSSEIASILNGIASRFSTEQQLEDLMEFASTVKDDTPFRNAILTAQSNLNWATEHMAEILAWVNSL